jgi:hypothetical protein
MGRYQLWVSNESQSFFREDNEQALRFAQEDGAQLVWEVTAVGSNEAMAKYHEHMGWEPYKPMLRVDGTPFPQDEDDECDHPDNESGLLE